LKTISARTLKFCILSNLTKGSQQTDLPGIQNFKRWQQPHWLRSHGTELPSEKCTIGVLYTKKGLWHTW